MRPDLNWAPVLKQGMCADWLWQQMRLLTRWNAAGQDPAQFQPWRDQREGTLSGFSRRKPLNSGMFDGKISSLDRIVNS